VYERVHNFRPWSPRAARVFSEAVGSGGSRPLPRPYGWTRSARAPGAVAATGSAGLARDHAGRLAAIARRAGLTASDALDAKQDAVHTLLDRPDIAALRSRPDDAARLLLAIVRNAARNLRRCRPDDGGSAILRSAVG
jgi:hypothetical protein